MVNQITAVTKLILQGFIRANGAGWQLVLPSITVLFTINAPYLIPTSCLLK